MSSQIVNTDPNYTVQLCGVYRVSYQSTQNRFPVVGEKVDGYKNLPHNHPTSASTMELFTNAVKEKDFPRAHKIIDVLGQCSSCIVSYSSSDLFGKHAENDSNLEKMLLKLYNKALTKSYDDEGHDVCTGAVPTAYEVPSSTSNNEKADYNFKAFEE